MKESLIYVVSGLPRSGTSMMMRMLEAGGIPAVQDHLRVADEDNPFGYYEFEPVKQLARDTSWLDAARGKAVKVIYRLLYDLPNDYQYRVIFMNRTLEEVIASQKAMLSRLNKTGGALNDRVLAQAYRSDLQKLDLWISGQCNFTLLYVGYDDVLNDSERTVTDICQFLDCTLDPDAMIKMINRSQPRQRAGQPPATG
jgi:hypothetical protein